MRTPLQLNCALAAAAAGCAAVAGCAGIADEGPPHGADRPLALGVEELWSVGGIEATGWESFSDRLSIAFDDAGVLRVFDAHSARIHALDREGVLIGSWGDRGEGPGELSAPTHLVVHGDGTTSVLDAGKWGFVRFDGSGDYLDDVRLGFEQKAFDRLHAAPGGGVVTLGLGMVADPATGKPATPEPGVATSIPIRYLPLDGGPARTIHHAWVAPPLPGSDEATVLAPGPKPYLLPALTAFQPEPHLAVLPDGRVLVADSVGWEIDVLSLQGGLEGLITRQVPPAVVDEPLRERERANRRVALAGQEPPPGIEGWREAEEARIELMLFADVLPVIEELGVDREGRIWVERRTEALDGAGPIDLMRGDGTYLGTVPAGGPRIPAAFGPEDLAAYIDFDEYDVPTVRVVRIIGLPQ